MNQKIKKKIKAFTPATIANLACGFDKLGVAIKLFSQENFSAKKIENEIGDIVEVTLEADSKESKKKIADTIKIKKIFINNLELTKNSQSQLDLYNPKLNKLTIPILHYLKELQKKENNDFDFSKIAPELYHLITEGRFTISLTLNKNIPFSSGLGSSACSSVIGVYAINKLLREPIKDKKKLLQFAILGECLKIEKEEIEQKRTRVANQHFDNIAPALCGGLINIENPLNHSFKKFNLPKDIFFVIFYGGQVSLNTSEMRTKLNSVTIPLTDQKRQEKYYINFLKALSSDNPNYPDYQLIKNSMKDIIVEPIRKVYIPLFDTIQKIALAEKNCLGCSLSGSGPSIFAMVREMETAEKVTTQWQKVQDSIEYQKAHQEKKSLFSEQNNLFKPFVKIFITNEKGTEEIE